MSDQQTGPPEEARRAMTLHEAARELDISYETLRSAVYRGRLQTTDKAHYSRPDRYHGGPDPVFVVYLDDVRAYLASRKKGGKQRAI